MSDLVLASAARFVKTNQLKEKKKWIKIENAFYEKLRNSFQKIHREI